MAMLMLFYQKMRKTREYNQAVLEQTKFGTKTSRIETNIKNVQKMYEGRLKRVQQTAQRMQSSASVFFQRMAGLDSNNVNINMMGFNGLTGYVLNATKGMLVGKDIKDKDKNVLGKIDEDRFNEMMQAYIRRGSNYFMYEFGDDGQPVKDDNDETKYKTLYKDWEVTAFKDALQYAQTQQSMVQQEVANTTQQYQNNVSIWLEAMEAQIEAEQDAALEPLEYEQTMMELDKAACDQKVTRLKSELDSYTQACEQEAKDSAPKFGL